MTRHSKLGRTARWGSYRQSAEPVDAVAGKPDEIYRAAGFSGGIEEEAVLGGWKVAPLTPASCLRSREALHFAGPAAVAASSMGASADALR
jgi:hypothetical protein